MDSRKDILVAVIVAALGLFILYVGYNLPPPVVADTIGPRAFPIGIGLMLFIGGAVLAVRRYQTRNAAGGYIVEAEGTEDDDRFPASGYRAVGLIALAFAFALTFQALGYLVSTPLFVAGGLLLMKERSPLLVVGSAVIYTAATFTLFSVLLGVRLPLGILSFIMS